MLHDSKMKNVLTNKRTFIAISKQMLKCYIEHILLYARETWTRNRQSEKHLMAAEMWGFFFFLRKMQRMPRADRKIHEAVLQETDENHKLML